MKRLTAILFAFLLLFNFIGYTWVLNGVQSTGEGALEAQLDKEQYRNEDLISVKTALNLPYYTSSPHFERVDGSLTIDGIDYKYVKRRVYRDTLEVLCVPDRPKMAVQAAKADFIKISFGNPAGHSKKESSGTQKINLPDYCSFFNNFSFAHPGSGKQTYLPSGVHFKSSGYSSIQVQPPDGVVA